MLTFTLPFFTLLLLVTTITTVAQPYKPTDRFLIDCGSPSTATSDGTWSSDERSKFVPSDITTTSFSSPAFRQDPSVDQIPYSTARIFNTSSFTYQFPVSLGPKYLRLYFYPATYSGLDPSHSFFSVSSNGYSLLTNFSAFLTVSYLAETQSGSGRSFVKEFVIYVKDAQTLNVTFTPSPSSFAFINGIEIVSMPENLYFNPDQLNFFAQATAPAFDDQTALENMYRLNMGGGHISGTEDTGMYRSWDQDDNYVFGAAIGLVPQNQTPISYAETTPNYTAPELVYMSQRSMSNLSDLYDLTWTLPVDSGFYYMLRLHFCSIIPQYTKEFQVIFNIFINNQTAETEADVIRWAKGSGRAVFKDYGVFVSDPDGRKSKQDLWLSMNPNGEHDKSNLYLDAFLNGLEVFKMSMDGNLASPNPETSSTNPPSTGTGKRKKKKKPAYVAIIGGIGGALVLLSFIVLVLFRRQRRNKHYGTVEDDRSKSSYGLEHSESKSVKSSHSTLPSDRCRRFSLTELKAATDEFNDNFVIGKGGFGKVYKGYIDNTTTTVAIKRLNESSSQGVHEFLTEIQMLSKLRHVQLVSLIGYCEDNGEMILVYDYMAHGTLREHLYKTNDPPLPWKRRLQICIGAAKGLHYLHTGARRAIIHRDVKSTNILLDENWVAKVSDFGLSKLGPSDQAQNHVSTVVKGSIGYVDPEYYRRRQLTDKSDVYSFGVVLLEVLCARPAMIPGLPKEQVSLAEWGKSCYRKGTLNEIIDPKLRSAIAPECLRKFGEVAISCLQDQGSERPAMEDVVFGLELALDLQEVAEKTGGEMEFENQEIVFTKKGELTTTTTDDDMFTGSSSMRNGGVSNSSSNEGFKSETVFTELNRPAGR